MTSGQPHPPAPILAELLEGVLDTTTEAGVEAHVRHCPTCTDSIERLRDLSTALRALPEELATPEHVSARVRAALAAERAMTVDAVDRPRSRPAEHDGATVAWFRRRLPQALAAAATVSVLGLAGYVTFTGGIEAGDGQSNAEVAGDAEPDADVEQQAAASSRPHLARETDGALSDDSGADLSRAELVDVVNLVGEAGGEVAPGCGQPLADDVDQPLVGSATVQAGVLVVLAGEADRQLVGWLLPTCDSSATEALGTPVVVPVPE